MEIRNKTKLPLRIPLPAGKRLHLPPGGTGTITPKASQHPPVQKLVDEDQVELIDTSRSTGRGGAGGRSGTAPSQDASSGSTLRHTGDR